MTVLKRTFSKGDTTNWSYKLFKITEKIYDTIPSYKIDNLTERYNEALRKKTELTMKEDKNILKALNINQIKVMLAISGYASQFIR